MGRKIISVVGAINAGKDTIRDKLHREIVWSGKYTNRASRCRFADSLNQAVAAILGIDGRELQDRSLKEEKQFSFEDYDYPDTHSSRDVQKQVGQLLRENLGSHVFINALDKRYPNANSILLISDLRYQNELDWVKRQGGKIVYIHNEKAALAQYQRECKTVIQYGLLQTEEHYPPESEELQWDFYSKVIRPDYWLDNNDFSDVKPFDDFVQFVVDYLEN